MNKFKKILLGVASVLTLGALFTVSSVKSNAAGTTATLNCNLTDTTPSLSDSYVTISYNGSISSGSSNTLTWQGASTTFTKILKMSKSSNVDSTSGVLTITSTVEWSAELVIYSNGTTAGLTITSSKGTVGGETTPSTKNEVFQPTITDAAAGTTKIYNASGKDFYLHAIAITYEEPTSGTYSVSYNMNGIGDSIDPSTGVTAIPDTLPSPTATGYTFGGWYTDSDCTAGNEAVAGTTLSSSITLYAKWTVNSSEWCTITFDSNGGSAVASTSQIYGSTYTLPNSTKSGYYLTGWSDGSNTYAETYTVPSTSTKELTAQWAECIVFDESCHFLKADNDNTASASNSMFTVSGNVNTNADATVIYNGETYNTPLKMESSTTLSFTLSKSATVYIAFASKTGNCKIQGGSYSSATKKTATNGVLVLELAADTYTITKADTNNIGFIGVIYDKLSDGTTASVFAEKNAAGDTLRFIGTLEGITELDNVTEVELILKKDGVASKKRIFLTTCYTSVSGSSQACETADGTYYVIYRLKGITGIEGTISKQLKVTFADGSTKLSDVTEFDL